jgi:hypothetical protein
MFEKSQAEATGAMAGRQMSRHSSALPRCFSSRRHLQDCLGELDRFVFKVNLLNGKKDLKTARSEAQNQRKKTMAAKKHFASALQVIYLRQMGHH